MISPLYPRFGWLDNNEDIMVQWLVDYNVDDYTWFYVHYNPYVLTYEIQVICPEQALTTRNSEYLEMDPELRTATGLQFLWLET